MIKKQPDEENTPSSSISPAERRIALVFAGAVLITFIVLVLNPRLIDGGTLPIVRFLAAIFAGIAGYLFTGNLNLEATIPLTKTQIRAAGSFAAFVFVFLLFFYAVPNFNSNGSTPIPTSKRVAGPIEYGYYRYEAADLKGYVFDQDDPNKCREMCLNEPSCKAWTTNTPPCNPDGKARCWLHSTVGTRKPSKNPILYCTEDSGVINE